MDIYFDSKKLEKICTDQQVAIKRLGPEQAKVLLRRMSELRAAENLQVFWQLPAPRCHALTNNRRNQFAADLKHPYRLIFKSAEDPPPLKPDGGLDYTKVTSVLILEVEDYHG